MELLRVALSVQTAEAYGLSETASLVSMQWPGDKDGGHVGPPIMATEIKVRRNHDVCPILSSPSHLSFGTVARRARSVFCFGSRISKRGDLRSRT